FHLPELRLDLRKHEPRRTTQLLVDAQFDDRGRFRGGAERVTLDAAGDRDVARQDRAARYEQVPTADDVAPGDLVLDCDVAAGGDARVVEELGGDRAAG